MVPDEPATTSLGAGAMAPAPAASDETGSQVNMAALLLRAFRWFEDGLLDHLERTGWGGVRRRHSLVFAHLDRGGSRPSELARRIGISRQAVHETVAEMEQLGLVELVPDPAHGRAKLLVLTERGRQTVAEAKRAFGALEEELGERIGHTRVGTMRQVLEADWGPTPTDETRERRD